MHPQDPSLDNPMMTDVSDRMTDVSGRMTDVSGMMTDVYSALQYPQIREECKYHCFTVHPTLPTPPPLNTDKGPPPLPPP